LIRIAIVVMRVVDRQTIAAVAVAASAGAGVRGGRVQPVPACHWAAGDPGRRLWEMSVSFTSLRGHAPMEDVAARDLGAGDVVRLDDPQAHRVERVVRLGARVVLELRPVGVSVSDTVCVTLSEDRLVRRLGRAMD